MFFAEPYEHFFRPLTGKYREQVVECLRLLYERLYTANADYGESLRREQIIEVFSEALTRAPQLDSEQGEGERRFKNLREQAGWVLNLLVDCGWLEKQVDGASLTSTYPFSRRGRLFTQPLVETNNTRVRTRHRNTRNTLNALDAFLARGEEHDLIDAWEYSERIVADFTDIISELEERRRELVREVESQQLVQQAADQFFQFMETRFQPDLAVRLSADSVEKHRDAINKVIGKVRRQSKERKAEWERNLRRLVPELVQDGRSVLWYMLDTIDERMRRACEISLPALRSALNGFTKRADIIIRQLSYMHRNNDSDLVELCSTLGAAENRAELLGSIGDSMQGLQLRLHDPGQVQLANRQKRRPVVTQIEDSVELDAENRRDVVIQQLLDQAFSMNNTELRSYVREAMGAGRRISSRDLPCSNAREMLAMGHALEVASAAADSSEYRFEVTFTGERGENPCFEFDEFFLELKQRD
ncbi:Wadjet anti-phage system protein JetA family protein [Biformimicrobium ophioploci]|uniref:Wadjet anti-phage system protein JetA family protein n=1 Tax=Biformimicrobium ophioploci TaxID=3036711 RepID=UPI003DA1BC4D